MRRLLVCSISALALTLATNALADNVSRLKGDYAFTGASHCINSNEGFTPAPANDALCSDTGQPITVPPPTGPFPRNSCPGVFADGFSVQGIRKFNGDGTGSVKGRTVSVSVPPNTQFLGGTHADFEFKFTYTVDADDGWTSKLVPGSFLGKILSGPRIGQTFTQDALTLEGLIGQGARTLTLASVVPEVQKQTFNNNPADSRYRICHRSRVLIQMDGGNQ